MEPFIPLARASQGCSRFFFSFFLEEEGGYIASTFGALSRATISVSFALICGEGFLCVEESLSVLRGAGVMGVRG